jgi:3-dehydroquinate synthase
LFDDRERAKSLATVEHLCRQLVRAGADRRAVLVALGGGVVGDVAGFVAASYLRGIALVHLPTTLVAQADSAIGGKTGVNLPEGKNLVGAFYQPRLVVADPATLITLPGRQYRSGLYEVIKYGVIGDAELFSFLEHNWDALVKQKPAALAWVLPRCIRAKAEVVRRDERESGLREILNFGHTVGHALESVTAYAEFLHGEAVGWGMMAATLMAVALGRLGPGEAARILRLIAKVGPLPALPRVSASRLLQAMRADKKARGGHLRFVLPRRIGSVEGVAGVPEALVVEVLRELPRLTGQMT